MIAANITNLRLKFPGAADLQFRDLSLTIRRGEKVLLLGPSGCGKSTLLQVLTGLIPHSVEVPVKYDEILVPERWGFVFQDPDTQFCMPYVDEELAFVLENLRIPRERMPELIDRYLQLVGLRLEDRHTPIQSLSQGMKQRLAIAGVLALEPDVLLLDEPTALLDPEGTDQVWETIKAVSHDKTLIIVEHKIDRIMDLVERIVLFNADGQIIADGPREQIFDSYKEELVQYGIWYPGVWDDYVERSDYPRRTTERRVASSAMPMPDTEPDGRDQTDKKPLVELQDFQAIRGKKTVTSVDHAELAPGSWVAIVGRNGAGKSTLLLALMQLIRTKGVCLISGNAAEEIDNLSDWLAFVFQNPEFQFVTNRTWDEIAYTLQLEGADHQKIADKVGELLQLFDLTEQQDQHPYQLSMGQKRRLSVASTVVKEQPVLLLDEPTFGQDAKSTFAILEKLEEWRRQGTIIMMVTHDLRIVRHFATQVWHVHDGRVDQYGEPESYLRLIGAYDQSAAKHTGPANGVVIS